jgi:hypothetical protein
MTFKIGSDISPPSYWKRSVELELPPDDTWQNDQAFSLGSRDELSHINCQEHGWQIHIG